MGDVAGNFLRLAADPFLRNGLEGAHEVDARSGHLGEADRLVDRHGGRLRPVGAYDDALEQSEPSLGARTNVAILNRVPRSWIISMAILVVCLLASMVIAATKLW
jgi:hypothetical protein